MNYTIVIVTYNRLSLLKECIHQCLSQTILPSHIVIVNNASTDGTKEYLNTLNNPVFSICSLETNTGGAGGFHTALSIASSFDDTLATLIIDDDALLNSDYCEQLIAAMKCHPKIEAFAGTVLLNGNVDTTHRLYTKRPGFVNRPVNINEYNKTDFLCDCASFCGLFIRNTLLKKIGLPHKEYFIWYDDTEYCIRIRKCTPILVITSAVLDHKTAAISLDSPRRYTWKDYYGIRNRLRMVCEHGSLIDRIYIRIYVFLHFGLRNYLFFLFHINNYNWKFEIKTYKDAVKDYKKN